MPHVLSFYVRHGVVFQERELSTEEQDSAWSQIGKVYTWITAPCLRRAFLDFLAVPEQYVILPLSKCCSRCSETQRKSDPTLSTAVVGYEGICDMELEK